MTDRTYISLSTLLLIVCPWLLFPPAAAGQEIDFSAYSDYGIQLFFGSNNGELIFGQNGNVISGEGQVEIPISSGKVVKITIEGIKFLDVFVDIQGSEYLYENGTQGSGDQISFDLKAAYANVGSGTYSQAQIIPVSSSNNAYTRFRIKGRGEGPPRPPPVPPHEGYSPPTDEAYLFLYGSIDVGSVNAGSYSSTVNVTVSYDTISQ